MSNVPDHRALVSALEAAGSAHHDYESRYLGGVRDEAWPGWYAAYVLGRLGDFASPTELAQWLDDADGGEEWAEDAATFVLGEVGGS